MPSHQLPLSKPASNPNNMCSSKEEKKTRKCERQRESRNATSNVHKITGKKGHWSQTQHALIVSVFHACPGSHCSSHCSSTRPSQPLSWTASNLTAVPSSPRRHAHHHRRSNVPGGGTARAGGLAYSYRPPPAVAVAFAAVAPTALAVQGRGCLRLTPTPPAPPPVGRIWPLGTPVVAVEHGVQDGVGSPTACPPRIADLLPLGYGTTPGRQCRRWHWHH